MFTDSVVWLIGKPGSGKSFVALDLAACVGTGESWQGYGTRQGVVLYLVAEGVHGVKQRVRAWESAMGQKMAGVRFLPMPVQVDQDGSWDALVRLTGEIQPTMVVLDTQARITVGLEENSNTAMGRFVAQIERLRQASGSCVLIVHHTSRSGENGRGASTVDGALDTIINVEKAEEIITLRCTKQKDAAEWDPIKLRAVPFDDSVVLMLHDGRTPTGLNRNNLATAQRWWDTHETDWLANSVLVSTLVGLECSESTFYRHRKELIKANLVEMLEKGTLKRYRLTHDPAIHLQLS